MYTMDAGTLCLQATDQLRYCAAAGARSRRSTSAWSASPTPRGLGIKLARPDRTVISLMGDGGFGMAA